MMEQNTDVETQLTAAIETFESPQPVLVLRFCFHLFSEILEVVAMKIVTTNTVILGHVTTYSPDIGEKNKTCIFKQILMKNLGSKITDEEKLVLDGIHAMLFHHI